MYFISGEVRFADFQSSLAHLGLSQFGDFITTLFSDLSAQQGGFDLSFYFLDLERYFRVVIKIRQAEYSLVKAEEKVYPL